MTPTERTRSIRPGLLLLIAAALTLLLGLAVGIAYMSRPLPFVVTVTEPPGAVVLCDFVVDGEARSHRDAAPVTYRFMMKSIQYAVIAESADTGDITVDVSTPNYGRVNRKGPGWTGKYQAAAWEAHQFTYSEMSGRHIASMRAARLAAGSKHRSNTEDRFGTTPVDESGERTESEDRKP